MSSILNTYCYTPLAEGTAQNLNAYLSGRRGMKFYDHPFELEEGACLSLFDREKVAERFRKIAAQNSAISEGDFSCFDKLAFISAYETLKGAEIDHDKCLFVLSTTKGNVDRLPQEHIPLASTASKIAVALGLNPDNSMVVSNACISGVCALNLASEALDVRKYDYALVTGADALSAFVVSGFQSFKALSPEPCMPFDAERTGLNLGEASASVLLTKENLPGRWQIAATSNHNDANHISGPSRTGEGSYRVLRDLIAKAGEPAMVSTHGTSTLYNDEMESIALHRAGLDEVPVCSMKGVFGHTLGAAGVLESALSIEAAERGIVPQVTGFCNTGTSYKLNISDSHRQLSGEASSMPVFKILSGFGGSNAGIVFRKDMGCKLPVNGQSLRLIADNEVKYSGKSLAELYHETFASPYPKFHKMDLLSKTGILVAEPLLSALSAPERENLDIIAFTTDGCLVPDTLHAQAIDAPEGKASPSVFVYTLPNILTGEIAIRHKCLGETSLYVVSDYPSPMTETVKRVWSSHAGSGRRLLVIEADALAPDDFHAKAYLYEAEN